MRYLGGKARLATRIVDAILADTTARDLWVEPFLGGASVLAKARPHFRHAIASDASPDLIACWSAVADGWDPPSVLTEDEYRAQRHAPVSALRGYVGFACSFGGKWFGGYARDPKGGRDMIVDAHSATVRKGRALAGTEFICGDYAELDPPAGAVVYCDPPYAGTTGYSAVGKFDHARFWDTMDAWSDRGCHVYVSELEAPDHWVPLLTIKRQVGRSMTPDKVGNGGALIADIVYKRGA